MNRGKENLKERMASLRDKANLNLKEKKGSLFAETKNFFGFEDEKGLWFINEFVYFKYMIKGEKLNWSS